MYMIRKLLWWLLAGSIAVAVIRVFPWEHPNQVWKMLGDYSNQFGAFISDIVGKLHLENIPKPDPIQLPTGK
jgi:hypothetical protein